MTPENVSKNTTKIIAASFLLMFILMQYFGFFLKKDFWPFSHFPMYSKLPKNRTYNWPSYEISVNENTSVVAGDALTEPFYSIRFNYSLLRAYRNNDSLKLSHLLSLYSANAFKEYPDAQMTRVLIRTWQMKTGFPEDLLTNTEVIFEKENN